MTGRMYSSFIWNILYHLQDTNFKKISDLDLAMADFVQVYHTQDIKVFSR